jgi:integrase
MIEKHQTKSGQVRYEVRLRGADGRERSRTFRTKKEAERYERGQQTDLDQGEWVDPRNGRVTLARWAAEWQRTVVHLRPTTQRIYDAKLRNHILPELGNVPLAKLTPSMLRGWLAGLTTKEGGHSRPLSLGSVAQVYRTLNRVLAAAVDNESLGRNPLRGVKPPRVAPEPMRFLSYEEVATLAEAIDPRYRALVLVAAYSGLRAGELIGLRRKHVDLLRRTITVVEQVQYIGGRMLESAPKSSSGRRQVALPGLVAAALEDHLALYSEPGLDGLVFPARGRLPAPGELQEEGMEPGHRGRRCGAVATP